MLAHAYASMLANAYASMLAHAYASMLANVSGMLAMTEEFLLHSCWRA